MERSAANPIARPPQATPPTQASELEAEVLRLNLRYLTEVVEAYGFCPFARTARETDHLRRFVLPQADEATEAGLEALATMERAGSGQVEVGLLIFPRHEAGLAAFARFAERLQAAYEARFGTRRSYVQAVFHPGYPLSLKSPGSLVGFIRKSPDPMLQYTSRRVLDAVKRALPTGPIAGGVGIRTDAVSAVVRGIADANYRAVIAPGALAKLEGILAAIAADRAASYARLGSVPGSA